MASRKENSNNTEGKTNFTAHFHTFTRYQQQNKRWPPDISTITNKEADQGFISAIP
jgi:diadenosine tetraphosphate (Ap4A) HIT family hydrolase